MGGSFFFLVAKEREIKGNSVIELNVSIALEREKNQQVLYIIKEKILSVLLPLCIVIKWSKISQL